MSRQPQRLAQDLLPGIVEQRDVDWRHVTGVTYLVQQRFRYEYPQPIRDLRHRLVVVPPDRHGDQRAVVSHVRVSADCETHRWRDRYGNVVVEFHVPAVESWIELDARIVVERAAGGGPPLVPADRLGDSGLLTPTPLTAPAAPLFGVAHSLRAGGHRAIDLAEAANEWTHRALAYRSGATGVRTTAAEALALGAGVCQDYAHVMLALCRLLDLPARYVSGHLLGEGGTHAWVEVLVPDAAGSGLAAVALDPTHGSRAGLDHVTVATGRDYLDVAPTTGTYAGAGGGRLTGAKRVDIVSVEHARARRTA
jgi:transglutaminase-like putative cysteine protease